MKGKVINVVQNSVVIKADVRTDNERIMSEMGSKKGLKEKYENFNPNKLVNYEILFNNKFMGKISKVIGRIDDFFLVGDILDSEVASNIVGEDVEILKYQTKKDKKKQLEGRYKKTVWKKQTRKR